MKNISTRIALWGVQFQRLLQRQHTEMGVMQLCEWKAHIALAIQNKMNYKFINIHITKLKPK